jgi:hypothetical protein
MWSKKKTNVSLFASERLKEVLSLSRLVLYLKVEESETSRTVR